MNLAIRSKSEVPSALRPTQTRRIDDEPNMFYNVESCNMDLSAIAGTSNQNATSDDGHIAINFNKVGTSQQNVRIDEEHKIGKSVQNLTVDGVRSRQQNAPVDEEHIANATCFNENAFFQMVRTTTTMNLFTLLYLMNFIPVVILGMVYHNCNVDTSECDYFLYLFNLFFPIRIVGLLVLSLIALQRLSNYD